MKNYLIPLGVVIFLVMGGVFTWYVLGNNEPLETNTDTVSDERYEKCMNFMMVAQFPSGGAADEFLAACLRGEPVLPEETGEVPPSKEAALETNVGPGCAVGGCSSQICGEEGSVEDTVTTCEYREEYACYQVARCEKQSNGSCGWTQTTEYNQCMTDIKANAELEV